MTVKKANTKKIEKIEPEIKEIKEVENKKLVFLEAGKIFATKQEIKYTINIEAFISNISILLKNIFKKENSEDKTNIEYIRSKYG